MDPDLQLMGSETPKDRGRGSGMRHDSLQMSDYITAEILVVEQFLYGSIDF